MRSDKQNEVVVNVTSIPVSRPVLQFQRWKMIGGLHAAANFYLKTRSLSAQIFPGPISVIEIKLHRCLIYIFFLPVYLRANFEWRDFIEVLKLAISEEKRKSNVNSPYGTG